jgi:hypothetical protein
LLALKLLLVPAFLWLVSAAGKRWGPGVAGWLAGLPVVGGPILFFIAIEHGSHFASNAAAAALAAVFASISFNLAYAHAAQRMGWPASLALALLAWGLAAVGLARLPGSVWASLCVATIALTAAPSVFPIVAHESEPRAMDRTEIALRMVAGALLTLAVTCTAGRLGQAWSGLFAVFPVLGCVLAVFTHRGQGAAHAARLLRAMAAGLYAFATFCFTLSVSLPRFGVAQAFIAATTLALLVQTVTRRHARGVAAATR